MIPVIGLLLKEDIAGLISNLFYKSGIYLLSQCSTTGVTKAVVCAILSVGWCI